MTDDDITPEYIESQIAKMKTYYLVLYNRGDGERGDEKHLDETQAKHLEHLFSLRKQGKMVLSGPLLVDNNLRGICLYACDDIDEVRSYVAADPMVQAGYLKGEVYPWMGRPGDTLP